MAIVNKTMNFVFFGTAAMALSAASGAQAEEGIGGVYGGLSFGSVINNDDFLGNGDEYVLDGSGVGAFVGYNVEKNNLVYGGELNYAGNIDANSNGNSDYSGMGLTNVIDVKARVGRLFGTTLVYGAVGFTSAGVNASFGVPSSAIGSNVSLGVEKTFSNNMFIGLELTHRNLNVEDGQYISNTKLKLDSASLRIGMNF